MLEDDGWRHNRTTGSHMMYIHSTKPGPVVVPAGGKEGKDGSARDAQQHYEAGGLEVRQA